MSIIPAPGHTTVILSAERGEYGELDNASRYQSLLGVAAAEVVRGRALAVYQLQGCYKGETEPSVAITMLHNQGVKFGRHIGKLFEQESVLFVDSAGNGKLYFLDTGDIENIGSYSPLHGAADAWTRVLATGEEFTFI